MSKAANAEPVAPPVLSQRARRVERGKQPVPRTARRGKSQSAVRIPTSPPRPPQQNGRSAATWCVVVASLTVLVGLTVHNRERLGSISRHLLSHFRTSAGSAEAAETSDAEENAAPRSEAFIATRKPQPFAQPAATATRPTGEATETSTTNEAGTPDNRQPEQLVDSVLSQTLDDLIDNLDARASSSSE